MPQEKGPGRTLPKYSREVIAQVLAANDIVDIIGPYVELKSAGSRRMKGLSPFSNEKTPSFMVGIERQTYHCFSTGQGGDAITFLMEVEGLSFTEALRKLADRAGVRLPAQTESDDRAEYLRTRLLEFGKFAAKFYRGRLEHPQVGRAGRAYLDTRKLNEETLSRFGVGYVPDGWSNLLDAARRDGYKEHILEASGLLKRGENGSLYDFFRNRAVFPIKDIPGNVVAFGGRDLGDSPAKYINSPETAVYKKSRVLYGLHEARDAMRKEKYAILVEGYFDLMRCFDAGIENVVASCGTALTPEQAALVRRYVNEVVLVYDGDAAGVKAAMRGTGVLTAAGLTVRAMALPDNQDPDDFVLDQGAEAFRKLVEEAPDFVSFYVAMSGGQTGSIEGRTTVVQELFGILQGMDDEVRRDEYLKRVGQELGLHDWACRREFENFRRRASRRPVRQTKEPAAPVQPVSEDDYDFLAALVQDEALLAKAKEAMAAMAPAPGPVGEVLLELFRSGPDGILHELESEEARGLYAAAASRGSVSGEQAAELVDKRINRLEQEALRAEAARTLEEIQAAVKAGDNDRVGELFARKVALQQQLEKVAAP